MASEQQVCVASPGKFRLVLHDGNNMFPGEEFTTLLDARDVGVELNKVGKEGNNRYCVHDDTGEIVALFPSPAVH